MARATARRSALPEAMREQANNVLEMGVDELAIRIRDAREGRVPEIPHQATAAGDQPPAAQQIIGPAAITAHQPSGNSQPLPAVPVEDNILVQIGEAPPGASTPGLVLPGPETDKPREGTVVAVGPGRWDEDGEKRIPLDVAEGDVVIYSKYGGTEIKYTGSEYLILSARDVLAVVNGVPTPEPSKFEEPTKAPEGLSPSTGRARKQR